MAFTIKANNVSVAAGTKFELPVPITAMGMTIEVRVINAVMRSNNSVLLFGQWEWRIAGGDPFLDCGFSVTLRRYLIKSIYISSISHTPSAHSPDREREVVEWSRIGPSRNSTRASGTIRLQVVVVVIVV